jgi:hypothetical protein
MHVHLATLIAALVTMLARQIHERGRAIAQ